MITFDQFASLAETMTLQIYEDIIELNKRHLESLLFSNWVSNIDVWYREAASEYKIDGSVDVYLKELNFGLNRVSFNDNKKLQKYGESQSLSILN